MYVRLWVRLWVHKLLFLLGLRGLSTCHPLGHVLVEAQLLGMILGSEGEVAR